MEQFAHLLESLSSTYFVGTILTVLNIILGFAACGYELREYSKVKSDKQAWAWIKLAYALICLFWGTAYLFILMLPNQYVTAFGIYILRPAITITLTVVTAGAYIRKYRKS